MKVKKPKNKDERIQTIAAVIGCIFTVLGFFVSLFKG